MLFFNIILKIILSYYSFGQIKWKFVCRKIPRKARDTRNSVPLFPLSPADSFSVLLPLSLRIVHTRIYRKALFNTWTVIWFDWYNIKRVLPTIFFGKNAKCEMQSVNSFCGIKCYNIWRKKLREWIAAGVIPKIFILIAMLTLIITCM